MKKFPSLLLILIALITILNPAISQVSLNLRVFLEGPFNGTSMNTDLNIQNLIPLNQPYNTAPWNYTGTELVSAIPNSSVVDWVLIELRETTGDASTATPDKLVHRQAAFLLSNGNIVATDGISKPVWTGSVTDNLYVVIRHRNHLAVMSSGPLVYAAGMYSWYFTNQLSKAYLNGQKQIGTSSYGMIGGDCDGSGSTIPKDKILTWEDRAGFYGFFSSDLNLDGQVDNDDKDRVYVPNVGQSAQLPEGTAWECGMDMTDARDGQIYSTVQIREQCWMAENLNYGTMIDGLTTMTDNSINEKYCFDNLESNCNIFGGLYQWDEVMQYSLLEGSSGLCPAGWHLPTDEEWKILEGATDSQFDYPDAEWDLLDARGFDVGGNLKEAGISHWFSPNNGGTDLFGFGALPGGANYTSWSFLELGYYGHYWTSSLQAEQAFYRAFDYSIQTLRRAYFDRNTGMSVRCVQTDEPQPWSCGDPLIDTRENQSYNTIQIGEQCWMAENLNIGTMINGNDYQSQQTPEIIEKYCFNNNTANCDTYGGLYQWDEAMQYSDQESSQGICPTGWHLPSDGEYTELTDFLGGLNVAGGKMKTTGTIEAGNGLWYSPNTGATNESGFSAVPGSRNVEGEFINLGYSGWFWTSTVNDEVSAWYRLLHYWNPTVYRDNEARILGISVRCIKDSEPQPWSCGNPIIDTRDNQSYNTVQIGEQCWMAENLNMGTQVNPYEQSNNGIIEKLCYDNNASNCNTYGGLYEWNEMMNYSMNQTNQGICPAGWRVPMLSEWESLISHLGGATVAGGKLKETGFEHWDAPNTSATNESGFTAIGGGRYEDGYGLLNMYANYWTSFFNGEDQFIKYVRYNAGSIESGYSYYEYRNAGSVRCIKSE